MLTLWYWRSGSGEVGQCCCFFRHWTDGFTSTYQDRRRAGALEWAKSAGEAHSHVHIRAAVYRLWLQCTWPWSAQHEVQNQVKDDCGSLNAIHYSFQHMWLISLVVSRLLFGTPSNKHRFEWTNARSRQWESIWEDGSNTWIIRVAVWIDDPICVDCTNTIHGRNKLEGKIFINMKIIVIFIYIVCFWTSTNSP